MDRMIPAGTAEEETTIFCGLLDETNEKYRRKLYAMGMVGVKETHKPQGEVSSDQGRQEVRAALCPMPDEFAAMHNALTRIAQHYWHPLLSALQTALTVATAVCLTEGVGFLEKSHRWSELRETHIPHDLMDMSHAPDWQPRALHRQDRPFTRCTAFATVKDVAEAYHTIAHNHCVQAVALARAEKFAVFIMEACGRAVSEEAEEEAIRALSCKTGGLEGRVSSISYEHLDESYVCGTLDFVWRMNKARPDHAQRVWEQRFHANEVCPHCNESIVGSEGLPGCRAVHRSWPCGNMTWKYTKITHNLNVHEWRHLKSAEARSCLPGLRDGDMTPRRPKCAHTNCPRKSVTGCKECPNRMCERHSEPARSRGGWLCKCHKATEPEGNLLVKCGACGQTLYLKTIC